MPTSLDTLMKRPTREELRALLLRELQGVGFSRQSGFSPGSVVVAGVPNQAYAVRVRIIADGALGSATFQWSTDRGVTWSSTLAVPLTGTYVIVGSGLSLVFTNGAAGAGNAFLAGDEFAIDTRVSTLPVTAWQPGSTPLTLVENDAATLEDLYDLVSLIAAGGFTSTARGPWLDLLAKEFFNLERIAGVVARGYVVLTDVAGAGPFNIVDGQLWFLSASGLRFQSEGAFTIPASDSVQVLVRAEGIGAQYNVANGSITTFVTPLPGVTVSNPDAGGGSWQTVQGASEESDELLAQRCIARWPELGAGQPNDAYALWARTADASIKRVKVRTSTTVAGRVELFLAGESGPAGAPAVAAADAYIQPRVMAPATALIQAATAFPYTVTATVYVKAGFEAQAAVDCARLLDEYNASIDVGGAGYVSAIIEALMTPAGVRNVVVTTPAADFTLTPTQVAVLTQNLSFVTV